jgi:hypothetical protein
MKSPQKKTPAKKLKQQASNMDETRDDSIVLDLGNYGAAQPTYTIGSGALDTITLDTSLYDVTGSVTVPSTVSWTQDYSINSWNSDYTNSTVNISADGITMKEGGDIKVGGKSLTEAIDKIEERLGILHPNPKLEDRWEQLKALRQQYMELEKDLLEKEKIMKILKES